ncbi:MAG: hypothetical protein ABI054_01955 [Planctomycetota bacterium]
MRPWLFPAAFLFLTTWAGAQEPQAKLSFEPNACEVGQPVRATLVLEHASEQHPKLASLGLDDSWVVLDTRAGLDAQDPARADRTTTTWIFEIASLEPGERKPAEIPLQLGETKVPVESAALSVTGVLAEAEDAPRPLRGLHDLEAQEERADLWTWIGAGAALACALVIAFYWWHIRRKPAQITAVAPSARLAILEAKPLDTPEDVQAAHFALTRLLRESADLRSGRDRSGLTDEEWRVAAEPQLDAVGLGDAERRQLDQLFADASRVKYGTERPTHWATREALAGARSLAMRFESPIADAELKPGVAA